MPKLLPALFVGHGNPMNAMSSNPWTDAWRSLGERIGKPRAILAISAHWYAPGTAVTANQAPRTIHDFGGFPEELYRVQYPAPGDPELARGVQAMLAPLPVEMDANWGLDHGTWSVLRHMYPDSDVPVVQLRIDESQPAAFHHEIGRQLAALRSEDVLVFGSGNLVHNLHTYSWGRHQPAPFEWAVRFEARAREWMLGGDHAPLIEYEAVGRDALLSIPTPEHYLPLLYVLGARESHETVSFPVEGVDGGSISMLAVQVGELP
jgi:4,5-DOPA dioxygenase extradiol